MTQDQHDKQDQQDRAARHPSLPVRVSRDELLSDWLLRAQTPPQRPKARPELPERFVFQFQGEWLLQRARQALKTDGQLTFRAPADEYLTPMNVVGSGILLMGLLIIGLGVAGILGVADLAEDGPWVLLFVGAIFVLSGYVMTFYVARHVQIDVVRRRWQEQQTGIRPFAPCTTGALQEWEQLRFAREQRTEKDEGGDDITWDEWSLSLIACGEHGSVLTVPGLDFPCETVSRVDALALAQQLARKLNLPLQEADIEHGCERRAVTVAAEVHGLACE